MPNFKGRIHIDGLNVEWNYYTSINMPCYIVFLGKKALLYTFLLVNPPPSSHCDSSQLCNTNDKTNNANEMRLPFPFFLCSHNCCYWIVEVSDKYHMFSKGKKESKRVSHAYILASLMMFRSCMTAKSGD